MLDRRTVTEQIKPFLQKILNCLTKRSLMYDFTLSHQHSGLPKLLWMICIYITKYKISSCAYSHMYKKRKLLLKACKTTVSLNHFINGTQQVQDPSKSLSKNLFWKFGIQCPKYQVVLNWPLAASVFHLLLFAMHKMRLRFYLLRILVWIFWPFLYCTCNFSKRAFSEHWMYLCGC